jgi:hypothetical protein
LVANQLLQERWNTNKSDAEKSEKIGRLQNKQTNKREDSSTDHLACSVLVGFWQVDIF